MNIIHQLGNNLYKDIFNNAIEGIFVHEIDSQGVPGEFIDVNQAACDIWGYTKEEFLSMSPQDLKQENEDFVKVRNIVTSIDDRKHITFLTEGIRKNGEKFPVEISAFTYLHNDQILMVTLARDISNRKRAEEKIKQAHQQLIDVIDFLPDPTFVIDNDKRIVAWNKSLEKFTGVSKAEVIGKHDYPKIFYGQERPLLVDFITSKNLDVLSMYENIKFSGNTIYGDTYLPNHNGAGVYLSLSATPLFDNNGTIVGAIQIIKDITEQKVLEANLKLLSFSDGLTGVYNRRYFDKEFKNLSRDFDGPVGIILCDLDNLKVINDTLGHDKGDKLIKIAGNLLQNIAGEECIVARLGGDEFAILSVSIDENTILDYCDKILAEVEHYNSNNPKLPLSISIGYSHRKDGSRPLKEILKEADSNMYLDKYSKKEESKTGSSDPLLKILESKDICTKDHVFRLESIISKFADTVDINTQSLYKLKKLALFHDIGKVGIPDRILLKPGKLTEDEFVFIKQHCEIGYSMAKSALELHGLAELILKHHEKWDGSGYPLGLKGEEIPIECRIIALVDAYDAMTNDRPYRKAMTHEEAIEEIRRCSGTHFDPNLVPKFIEAINRLRDGMLGT